MLLLLFTNIFIHIQQPSLRSKNIFIRINGVFLIHDYVYSHLGHIFIHIQRVIFIHIHDRNMVGEMVQNSQKLYSFSIFCAPSLRIIRF